MRRFIGRTGMGIVLLGLTVCVSSQSKAESPDTHALIEQGDAALA
jgi:hypothetical protein